MIECKHCNVEKEESQMAIRAGKPSRVCIECKEKKRGGRHSKKSPSAVSRRRKAEPAAELEIDVPGGGHGFKASLTDEGALLITQENADTEADNIVLTRAETRALIVTFYDWATKS